MFQFSILRYDLHTKCCYAFKTPRTFLRLYMINAGEMSIHDKIDRPLPCVTVKLFISL